jgi:hypothetical protein
MLSWGITRVGPVAKWNFPPGNDDYLELVARLPLDPGPVPHKQHVVSRAILRGFATPGSSGRGWSLTPFDVLEGRQLSDRGLRGCAYVEDFIVYAAQSAELVWKVVEDRLPGAIAAARQGFLHTVDNGGLRDTITDAIALHFVRSSRRLRQHLRIAEQVTADVRTRALLEKQTMLVNDFVRRYGLIPAGPDALETVVDGALAPWRDAIENGALTRVALESLFERIRSGLRGMPIEVWHVPLGNELLISDNAAFTFAYTDDGANITTNMAFGDSHGVVLPLASDCLVAVGSVPKDDRLVPAQVAFFNDLQIRNADAYVYFRPRSALAGFVKQRLAMGVRASSDSSASSSGAW